jgi:hypothetical protein
MTGKALLLVYYLRLNLTIFGLHINVIRGKLPQSANIVKALL